MNLSIIAQKLGGEISGTQILAPGPGHRPHDRSLCLTLAENAQDGFLAHSFSGDDWRDCRDYVKARLGISKPANLSVYKKHKQAAKPVPCHTKAARTIWDNASLIYGTPAEAYLTGRGLVLPGSIGHALRYHPACPFKGEKSPALVAQMVDIHISEFQGIHRTRLNPKDKAMLGPARAAVVKLSPDCEVTSGLFLCEGIETGLALIAIGFKPLWACLSAGGIARFPVLAGIECLTIFSDNDLSETGQMAAFECAARWRATGCEVQIFTPPETGTDFADWSKK